MSKLNFIGEIAVWDSEAHVVEGSQLKIDGNGRRVSCSWWIVKEPVLGLKTVGCFVAVKEQYIGIGSGSVRCDTL